jgi:hypothetical protein
MGQWTGTNGALGADCHRLLMERESLLKEIEDMKAEMEMLPRAAHAALDIGPTETTSTEDIPVDWILRGEQALKKERYEEPDRRPLGAAVIDDGQGDESPAERLLLDALAAVRDRRKKYGPPQEHFRKTIGMINACFGTSFRPEDWATIMEIDKIARSQGPNDTRDNNVDMAGYAACRDECQQP